MTLKNRCWLNYQYRYSPDTPIIKQSVISNTTSTTVVKDTLYIKKNVNKENGCLYDTLTYTITISNPSTNTFTNVRFKDAIPKGTRYIINTLQLNDTTLRCTNPADIIYIGNIEPNESYVIKFKVLVCSLINIKNRAIVSFDFIYNVTLPPVCINLYTNIVETKIDLKSFKQINNSCSYYCNILPKSVESKLIILYKKFLPYVYNDTIDLLVIGVIEYDFNFDRFRTKKAIPFTTTIALPSDANLVNDIFIKTKIENISYSQLCGSILIDSELLLYII